MIFPIGSRIIRLPQYRYLWDKDCEARGFPADYAFTVLKCDENNVILKETDDVWDTCRFSLALPKSFKAEDWL